MGHVWNGMKLLLKRPQLWPAAAAPLILASIAYLVTLFSGFWTVVPRMKEFAAQLGAPDALGWVTSTSLFALLWALVSGPLFLVAFCTVAVFAWDKLSKGVETAVNGTAPGGKLSFGQLIGDISLRVGFAVMAGVTIVVLGFLGLGYVGAVIAGWMMLYDLTAATYARRGLTALGQAGRVHKCRGWVGFWLSGAVVSLVPGINVLLLPVFVTGATLMVVESERMAADQTQSSVE